MKNNQLKLGVILSYISIGVNVIIQLIYTPLMIRLLGQSEYGVYTLVGSVVSYLSLFSLGFNGAYFRFYSQCKEHDDDNAVARLNGMFLSLFIGIGIIALICGMLLSRHAELLFGTNLTAGEMTQAKLLMRILVINIALTFPISIFDSIVGVNEKFVFQKAINLLGNLLNPFVCLPLLLMGYKSGAIVVVTTVITLVKLVVNIWYCLYKLKTQFIFRAFDLKKIKEIAGFSVFLFINMLIDQINWSVDKVILGRMIGTTAVAVYGVGAQINSVYLMFSTAISSVFAPRVNRIAALNPNDLKEQFTNLFIKVGRIQFLILALIITGFYFFGHYFIVNIFASPEYEDAYQVALYLIVPVTIPLVQNLGIEIQRALNKHQFRSLVYLIMAIANIVISILLVKKYGMVGAAMGTAISLLLANGLIMNIFYHKIIEIDVFTFWKSILSMTKGLLPSICLGLLIKWIVVFDTILEYAVYIALYIALYIIGMWFGAMNKVEKRIVLDMLYKFKKRKLVNQ